jgi:hypothetical protein
MFDQLNTNARLLVLYILCLIANVGCKKDADIPMEVNPADFYVRCNIMMDSVSQPPFEYRGGQVIELQNPVLAWEVGSASNYSIGLDSIKRIQSGLRLFVLSNWFISVGLQRDAVVADGSVRPEWTKWELETLLVPGRKFPIGTRRGEARLLLSSHNSSAGIFPNDTPSNDAYLRLESVKDYGSPEIGIPYYGKLARFTFAGSFTRGNTVITIREGEANILFRYFNY